MFRGGEHYPGLVKFFPLDKTDAWAVELAEMSPVAKRSDEKTPYAMPGTISKTAHNNLVNGIVNSSIVV